MKIVASFVGALMILFGLTGVFWPEGLMELAKYSFTPGGVWVVAIIRVLLGALLVVAAGATLTPKTIRVIGFVILVAGIAFAFIPPPRAQLLSDWLLEKGPDTFRIVACLPLALGILRDGRDSFQEREKPVSGDRLLVWGAHHEI